jgi:hypothetical protein
MVLIVFARLLGPVARLDPKRVGKLSQGSSAAIAQNVTGVARLDFVGIPVVLREYHVEQLRVDRLRCVDAHGARLQT